MKQSDIDFLNERADILDEFKTVQRERDDRIRKLLADDVKVSEIMVAARITKSRVYQIRDAAGQ